MTTLPVKRSSCPLGHLVLIVQVLRDLQSSEDVLVVEFGILPRSEEPRNLEDVLDLTTVHVQPSQLIQLLGGNDVFLWRIVQEVLPDGAARCNREFLVVEGNVDARSEGGIECVHAIRRQEHGTFEILED